MARRMARITAAHAAVCVLAWSVALVERGVDAVTTWGTEDQTAVVGRLFELRLPGVENDTVLTVRCAYTLSIGYSQNLERHNDNTG